MSIFTYITYNLTYIISISFECSFECLYECNISLNVNLIVQIESFNKNYSTGNCNMMKHIIIGFIVIMLILFIPLILYPFMDSPIGQVVAEIQQNESKYEEPKEFRVYTKAVCENVSGTIICHDEVFASCQGSEHLVPRKDVNGTGIFSNDWKDPRND